jgi:flagellar assembly protein FliH
MSSSPDSFNTTSYNGTAAPEFERDHRAGAVQAARFDVDLRQRESLPTGVMEQLRSEAHAAGYAAGWAQGRHAADAAAAQAAESAAIHARTAATQQAAAVQRAVHALMTAAADLERRVAPAAVELEDTIVASAFAIAQAIVGRELATATKPGADALARVLALAPLGRPVTVRLCPSDLATVTAVGPAAGPAEIDGRTVTLLADATLSPGDAVAQCDAATIDARIAPALARVGEALGL